MRLRSLLPMTCTLLFGMLSLATPLKAQARVHYSLLGTPARSLPSRLLVLPARVEVSELFAGGVMEKVPAWTAAASANLSSAVKEALAKRKDVSVLDLPPLSLEQQAIVEEHLAIYEQVGSTAHALTFGTDPAWEHKRTHFDYTLGNNLKFLKDLSGADSAVLIIGEDVESSGGRKTAAFFGALVGAVIPVGRSFVSLAVVDLETGDLLWMYYTFSPSKDLKEPKEAALMVQEILTAYPGLPARP